MGMEIMKILVIFFMTIFIQSCLSYSSDEAWHNLNQMYKEANGREICMKYKGNVHVMYYCENENKEQ
ncbi:voltage-gated ion channel superfamily potassium/ion transporter [Aggregatibacter segnis ATCC 33393]|jgi:lipoprotein|uniref:Voltage-gated ion channel superfamily potassium/ion transporter n=1 Tax=Aggregatibacter segnis ATCC 33393 TaxID=888057 RepID=E6KV75_9PAST|nr:voltage-gated ion channel superfamily potassium/ion transporter [Aggregatibacter segnis ATCC 33393]